MRLAVLGALALLIVGLLLSRARAPEEAATRPTPVPPPAELPTPARAAATTTTSAPPTTSSTLAAAPLTTPEDARRFLESQGVDPDRVAKEVAEQLRRRRATPGSP